MKIDYGFAFRPFEEGGSAGNLHLWVEYNGVRRSVGTRYELKDSEWSAEGGRMVLPNAAVRRRKLTRYESGIERDLRQMGSIVQRFENMNTEYSSDDIKNRE